MLTTSWKITTYLWILVTTILNQSQVVALVTTPSAYGIGKEGFNGYLSQDSLDPVTEGGWFALKNRYVAEVGNKNFNKFKSNLPKDIDVVAAGGYNNLIKLAADPKSEIVTIIKDSILRSSGKLDESQEGKIDALVALLQSQGKGFSSVVVDGEWVQVFTRQGKKSAKTQKLLSKGRNVKNSLSNFHVPMMEFENLLYTPRSNGCLKATVKYNPLAENFEKDVDGKIILRRISCDITDVNFKYWKLPTIPVPLKRSGGHLDFLYLDDDIRVTRGNRGGLFFHFRPAFLEMVLNHL